MRQSNWDLALVAVIAGYVVLMELFNLTSEFPFVILSVVLVLIVTGYALTVALFPQNELDIIERIMISVGASLALAALGGLVLNWSPVQLESTAWAVLLAALSWIFAIVAFFRRRANPVPSQSRPKRHLAFSWSQISFLVLAAVISVAAVSFAYNAAEEQATAEFTQLWITAENTVPADGVQVGVHNQHSRELSYRLELFFDESSVSTEDIELAADEEWTQTYVVPSGSQGPLEARLYLSDEPDTVHRRVSLTVGEVQ